MKICSRCKVEKELSEFSKNRARRDGFQHACKECRREAEQKYQQTEAGGVAHRKASRNYRLCHPEKIKTRYTINNALVAGKLTRPSPCEGCLKKRFAQAHHEDYSKPFEIDWLCKKCHVNVNKTGGVLSNG